MLTIFERNEPVEGNVSIVYGLETSRGAIRVFELESNRNAVIGFDKVEVTVSSRVNKDGAITRLRG